MADFINTVDAIGDDALVDAIIKRTVTEYKDASITVIGREAFAYCSALTEVDLPSATTMDNFAFSDDTNLIKLILRNTEAICSMIGSNAIIRSAIQKGTGYIYVPSALLDSYKAATNWSPFAAQFRALEDYTVDGTTTGELDPTKI